MATTVLITALRRACQDRRTRSRRCSRLCNSYGNSDPIRKEFTSLVSTILGDSGLSPFILAIILHSSQPCHTCRTERSCCTTSSKLHHKVATMRVELPSTIFEADTSCRLGEVTLCHTTNATTMVQNHDPASAPCRVFSSTRNRHRFGA